MNKLISALEVFRDTLILYVASIVNYLQFSNKNKSETRHILKQIRKSGVSASTNIWIERNVPVTEGGILLRGWARNSSRLNFAICNPNFSDMQTVERGYAFERPDVSQHFRDKGMSERDDVHGFVLVDSHLKSRSQIRVVAYNDQRCELSIVLDVSATVPIGSCILDVLEEISMRGLPSDSDLAPISRMIERGEPAPPIVEIDDWYLPPEGDSEPEISIIIPFYREDFFLFDHIEAQSRAPANVEWIIVCDDPGLVEKMRRLLDSRRDRLRQPTRFVALKSNAGFAQANNVGVARARGKYLLFMNSDIHCRDFSPIQYGVDILEKQDDVGIVGFSLMFEDGTIQHEGMVFEQSSIFRQKWVTAHPGKGLPATWGEPKFKEIAAVTGALMLLRRSEFDGENIFDPEYLIGDFEDGDLCMRVHERGKKIGLVTASGIYHLERQSIRQVGAGNVRLALTYLNCGLLNRRWGKEMEALSAAYQDD